MDNDKISSVNSIFQQPWWLDAVAPGSWDVVEIYNNGQLSVRFPYIVKKKMGLTLLTMPKLTQTLGPWLAPLNGSYAKQLARQKDLMNALIEQLPPHDYFNQNFHYSITNWLPYHWQGFTQTTRYTYVLDNIKDLDTVWGEFKSTIRTNIRKAQKELTVQIDLDIEKFISLNNLTFQRQRKSTPYSRDFILRLDEACVKNKARRIFFAEDAQGRLHAASYIVWDENSAYFLMGGADPELRNSGAQSLLFWEAIKFAATVTKKFDFEGSMIESIERYFRSFGAIQTPYFNIQRMSRRMKLLRAGQDLVNALVKN